MSSSDLCEPGVENCATRQELLDQLIIQPDSGAFFSLIGIYFMQIVSPIFSFVITSLIVPANSSVGYELLLWLLPNLASFYIYGPMFVLQLIYWLLDFPAWLTRFLIEHVVSNLVFLITLANIGLGSLVASENDQEINLVHFSMTVFNVLQMGTWWYATMAQSPDAIRFIDPSWNDASPNGLLWPSIFYLFGASRNSDF